MQPLIFNIMETYLLAIYNGINAKTHFISEVVEAANEGEATNLFIGKKYYFDSEKKRILGTCRKAEVIHLIK
jgi:hypothetical protein